MNAFYYIGLDIHKKTISYCIKTSGWSPRWPRENEC